ncbi:MAG: threonylcarbamoyl-AMP synthase [Paludibacter sp.]|nr:threonylcarbamoyl-AMP synthase [Paludibacter sp.]
MKIGTDIELAAQNIREGGLVAFPTETVYGLGADAFNTQAVAKIFEAKERPTFDPLIVHISSLQQLDYLFDKPINNLVYTLAEIFWPGPLTIVHRKNIIVSGLVTAGLDTVAVRMPSHPIALSFINQSQRPIAAPSANKFGQLSPTRHEHVVKQNMNIDYILQDNFGIMGLESTVVYVEGNNCTVLRPGIITLQQLMDVIPQTKVLNKTGDKNLPSPGLLKSHYSPKKPLYLLNDDEFVFPDKSGVILHAKKNKKLNVEKLIYTSKNCNLIEVAANMFSALHDMEENENIQQIYIETVPENGLGVAIMDRMKKAAYKYAV